MRAINAGDFLYLLLAMRWTIMLSVIAFLGGGIVGVAIALMRVSQRRWLRWGAVGYIQIFQGTPLLLQLFLVFFGSDMLGMPLPPWFAASLGLSLNAGAFLGEIWRGSIQAVPRSQREAATALGLHYFTTMRKIIVPQAMRIAVAPTVGFLVQVVKGTALASVIGFIELTKAGTMITNATFRPFTVYACLALMYFALCYPISAWSKSLESKLHGKH